MREKVLHYIWQNRLFDRLSLQGKEVQVVQVGTYNDGDGPDFSLVKIQTPDLLWVGAVEIHLRSSDWMRHGHDKDPRYSGVILHVVLEQDTEVYGPDGRLIPTAVLEVADEVLHRVKDLDIGHGALRCTPEISLLSPTVWHETTAPLLSLRMQNKISKLTQGSESAGPLQFFYLALMRYMGAHINNDAMEVTARSLPHSFLRKHASDGTALEAMLIGQAGLFAETPRDEYEEKLQAEYTFYRSKFDLTPIPEGHFRKLHVRPASYPTRRLAIVAALLQREEELLTLMQRSTKWEDIQKILSTPPSEYWCTHIDFGQMSHRRMRGAGADTTLSLLINVIIPTAYYFAISRGEVADATRVLHSLESLPAEKNKITQLFGDNKMPLRTAADSQRTIELYTQYCERHRCLDCPVAPEILTTIRHHE